MRSKALEQKPTREENLISDLRAILIDLQRDIDQPEVRYCHSDVKIIWNRVSDSITNYEESAPTKGL